MRRRLSQLSNLGLVSCCQYATFTGGALNYYKPTPLGFHLIQGVNAKLPPRSYFREVSLALQEHTRALADFVVAIHAAAHQQGIKIGSFYRENDLRLKLGSEALQALVGEQAKGLSPNVIVRLKDQWAEEYEAWSKRDLSDKHYVYVWADGIYAKVRLEDDANQKQCMLVLMGATADGKKELIAVLDGYRESKQSWRELLLDLKNRGLTIDPKLAIGDGALGFWAAIREVFPQTREQRCWVHKTANVLNKMPKSVQPESEIRPP